MINITDEANKEKIIMLEKKSLSTTLEIQKTFNKQILMYIKNVLGSVHISSEVNSKSKKFKYLDSSSDALNKSNDSIMILENLIKQLDSISKADSKKEEKELIEEYNSNFSKKINKVYSNTKNIEEFIHTSATTDFSYLEDDPLPENDERTKKLDKILDKNEMEDSFIENTLIISEVHKKVILPYKIERLADILLTNSSKYKSLNDIVEKLYTRPIKYYKPSAFSRFRETYKLMREREKAPFLKCFSLALELFGMYNLHPAIITACKNLDQLDIYLACLEDNTLSDFHFFDIKFEVRPSIY